jgi:large subunit ribosomal protein L17
MRHQRTGKKLGRDSSHRRALYANLTAELIEHERIKTTVTKAKAVKPIAEQMITLGRRGDMHARRQAVAFLGSKDIVHKLFAELGPRYAERPGGYSRIVRLGPRPGDAAEMVYLELVDTPLVFRSRMPEEGAEVEAAAVPAEADAEEPGTEKAPEAEAEGEEPEAEAETSEPEGEAGTEEADAPAEAEPEPVAAEEPADEAEAETAEPEAAGGEGEEAPPEKS